MARTPARANSIRSIAFASLALIGASCSAPATEHATTPAVDASSERSTSSVKFVEDDFEGAIGAAHADGKLVFVDAWAPWCHTCLSMRDEVLARPELGRFSDRYVFVAVDTDRPSSAGFLERYRLRVWPTFFVIDPSTKAVLAMHGGAASLDELEALLTAALSTRSGAETPGETELIAAHAAYADKRLADAARSYEDAATKLPDARRTEALLAAMRTHYEAKENEACVEFGVAHALAARGAAAPSDFLFYLKECATALGEGAPRDEALAFVRERLRALVAQPPVGATIDDRSDTIGALAELLRHPSRVGADDASEAKRLEQMRLDLLEGAAKAAASPIQAQTFDYARMNAYLALGRGDDAVAMFEQRIRELPDSYEAHARLGATLLELGRFDRSIVALDRAIELSYGPRRLRYMAQKAKALEAAKALPRAIATLEEEVRGWGELPAVQRDDKKLADAKKRLEDAKQRSTVN